MNKEEEYDFLEEEGNELDEERALLAVIGDIPSNIRKRVSAMIRGIQKQQTENSSDS